MNKMEVYTFENHDVRMIFKDGQPWWVLKDVCDVLDIGNSRMVANRLDDDEKGVSEIDTLGGKQEVTIVNESGLYNVILRSDKPNAKEFKRWVTHDVLPSIRKYGAYMTPEKIEELLLNPDTIINLATQLKSEREQRIALEKQVEEQQPKVAFADSVSASETCILIGELAKILKQNGFDIGQNRLFKWMRDNKYLISRRSIDHNMPTQHSMQLGLFRIKETSVVHPDGSVFVRKTPTVTGKGQVYFLDKFKEHALNTGE